MNSAVRQARLRGAREAERILSILEVRSRLSSTNERVDVFDALAWLDVRVIFRPLKGLLGAYIRGGQPGALISTNRPLSVQRFTAAHELGHAILKHEPSLDSPDVLRRAASSLSAPAKRGFASYLQEIEADAFAGAFLLPIWLITHHARKQGWTRSALASEDVVYQLSLRCGSSYQATVWALERNKLITIADRDRLLEIKPKAIKSRLGHRPPQAETKSDAWELTVGDAGVELALVVGDTVTATLTQHAGAGFLWKPREPLPNQLKHLATDRTIDTINIGAPSKRHAFFRAEMPGNAEVLFEHRRPWDDATDEHACFKFVVMEPEHGLSRANRARMLNKFPQRQEPNVN